MSVEVDYLNFNLATGCSEKFKALGAKMEHYFTAFHSDRLRKIKNVTNRLFEIMKEKLGKSVSEKKYSSRGRNHLRIL